MKKAKSTIIFSILTCIVAIAAIAFQTALLVRPDMLADRIGGGAQFIEGVQDVPGAVATYVIAVIYLIAGIVMLARSKRGGVVFGIIALFLCYVAEVLFSMWSTVYGNNIFAAQGLQAQQTLNIIENTRAFVVKPFLTLSMAFLCMSLGTLAVRRKVEPKPAPAKPEHQPEPKHPQPPVPQEAPAVPAPEVPQDIHEAPSPDMPVPPQAPETPEKPL